MTQDDNKKEETEKEVVEIVGKIEKPDDEDYAYQSLLERWL